MKMTQRSLPQENLARNLRYLMDRAGHKPVDLAAMLRGKVSKSTIHNILNQEKIARIDTVEYIAEIYGLSGWHLISPTLIQDIAKSPAISKLVADYEQASPEGRAIIEQIADREARYPPKT